MTRIGLRGLALCLLAAALAAAGCGGGIKTYPVRGKVTYNGKAVPNGTVTFISATGPSATGELQKDGSYSLKTTGAGSGAPAGSYAVIVVAMEDMADRLPEDRRPLPPPLVPNKYSSAATTDLKAEVEAKENVIDFDLKGEKTK
jgi:hypothetical protein